MSVEIKVPAVGESIKEATIGQWLKKSGEYVKTNDVLLMLETDKASVEVVAENDGVLKVTVNEGTTVPIGSVVGSIDTAAAKPAGEAPKAAAPAPTPAPATKSSPAAQPQMSAAAAGSLAPSVRRIVSENGLSPESITGTGRGGRITKEDAMSATQTPGLKAPVAAPAAQPATQKNSRAVGEQLVERVPMTTIRKKIAERLVSAQQTAAILTTFNEVDMTNLLDLREKYKDRFEKKYNIKLGFMGFFVKAVIEALKAYPAVNASIEGNDILYKHFYNIGVAVSTPKGLVVPVIKNADQLSLAEIELSIQEYANKARDGKISVDDMMGGTFTVSNGGVFGSLMSTPILNPPQSGILGMHKTEKRPVVVNDQIVIRPMMYLALSYDHRMIDGKESVSFLVRVKECVEDPSRILLEV